MKRGLLIFIYSFFWRNFLKIFIGLKYYNNNTLKNKKQFIIIANHNSHMDTMAIMSAIPPKYIHRVHPMAAEDFFGGNKIKEVLLKYLVNAVLIKRNRDDLNNDPIAIMDNLLKCGRSLILYPEGSRGIAGVMSNFKSGLGHLIQQNPNINVIPVYLDNVYKTLPKGRKLIIPYKCSINFGETIKFESYKMEDILITSKNAMNIIKTNIKNRD